MGPKVADLKAQIDATWTLDAPGEPSRARMVVVVNWFEELRRLVPTK